MIKMEDLYNIVEQRVDNLLNWFKVPSRKQHIDDQAYLQMNSKERAIFKYGYLMALKDLQNVMKGK